MIRLSYIHLHNSVIVSHISRNSPIGFSHGNSQMIRIVTTLLGMADDRLPKRAAELRDEDRRRGWRLRLRWEDCVMRDVRKAGEEEDWKKKTGYRGGWNRLRRGGLEVADSISPPTKEKMGRESAV